ncbi:MAG TPA: hypothetical protein VN873_08565 [Candidatus Angelobacter sp.]|nr:hypothetical protein [Candidatus Angelobacter sp.]
MEAASHYSAALSMESFSSSSRALPSLVPPSAIFESSPPLSGTEHYASFDLSEGWDGTRAVLLRVRIGIPFNLPFSASLGKSIERQL